MNLASLTTSFLSPTNLSEVDMKMHINFTNIFIFSTILKIPFQNRAISFIISFIFFSHSLKKLPFQSEAKYMFSRFNNNYKLKNKLFKNIYEIDYLIFKLINFHILFIIILTSFSHTLKKMPF
jgi:hypothetical protein